MKHTILVMGMQWGDEGKGKIVHALTKATNCDLIVRFNGGANAGHTIELDSGERLAYRQLPSGSGIEGVRSVIANGAVIDFIKLKLEHSGKSANLMISTGAHVVTSEHAQRDANQEMCRSPEYKIGTTLTGNGPVHSDKAARYGMTVRQLIVWDKVPEEYQSPLDALNSMEIQIMNSQEYLRYCQLTEGGTMILEGAHGWELDIDHGDYPFVTSSSCGIGGAAIGTGLNPRLIDEVIGVVKAYSTRVGAGTFPGEMSPEEELLLRGNHPEVGTNTKRSRRVDWMDIGRLQKACAANGVDSLALTHIDALWGFDYVKLILADGECLSMPGWDEDLQDCKKYDDLPENAKTFVKTVENHLRTHISLISVGPKESQLIWRCVE
ncbi:adenylosuccinate synthetase [bacterium]|nr:adenylosuccinate synthetase [bacterium]